MFQSSQLAPFRSPSLWPGLGLAMMPRNHLPFVHYDYDLRMEDPYRSLDPYVDRCCVFCDALQEFVGHLAPHSPPTDVTYSQI
jgi:hypothetical protein